MTFLEVDKDLEVRTSIHRVAELAFRCLSFDRDARPTMVEVAQELDFIAYDKSNMDSNDSTGTSINDGPYDSSSSEHKNISGVVVQYSWSSSQSSS